MAWNLDDRWLWLGFSAFLFVAAKGIAYGLQDILYLTEIDASTENNVDNESHVEDSISLESLQTLAASPNPDIAHATISLLVSRLGLSDPACTSLTLDLFSPSKTTRARALRILELLDDFPLPPDFPKPEILRYDCVRDMCLKADERTLLMCRYYRRALNRLYSNSGSYVDVARAVEAARTEPLRAVRSQHVHRGGRGSGGANTHGYSSNSNSSDGNEYSHSRERELSVESLDQLLARDGSTVYPLQIPTAALSALLHAQGDRRGGIPLESATRRPEESPEEAEVRRRRNRSARVMEVAEEYIIV